MPLFICLPGSHWHQHTLTPFITAATLTTFTSSLCLVVTLCLLFLSVPYPYRLPYIEAVVHESLRKASLAALGAVHEANRDTQLGGYTIPKVRSVHVNLAFIFFLLLARTRFPLSSINSCIRKSSADLFCHQGAIIIGSIFALHDDPRYWDSPEEFRPERWLNAEGKFVATKEGFMPFGSGELSF